MFINDIYSYKEQNNINSNIQNKFVDDLLSIELVDVFNPDYLIDNTDQIINNCVFNNDKSILYISNQIEYLNSRCFQYEEFKSVTSIYLSNTIKHIDPKCFQANKQLKYIRLSKNIKVLFWSTFEHCYSLEQVILPENLVVIGAQAFSNCKNLKNIIFNKQLKMITCKAFQYCLNLDTLNFSNCDNCKIITNSFSHCNINQIINLPLNLLYFNNHAFTGTNINYIQNEQEVITKYPNVFRRYILMKEFINKNK